MEQTGRLTGTNIPIFRPEYVEQRPKKSGRRRNHIKHGRKCKECTVRIFKDADQAALARVRFQAHLNLNIDGRCPACAGYSNVPYLEQKEIETTMTRKAPTPTPTEFQFGKVETNVQAPASSYSGRGRSKYAQPAKIILEATPNQWHRMKIDGNPDNKKAAQLLKGHVYKVAKSQGVNLNSRILVEKENDTLIAWLYWHLQPTQNEAADA